MMSLDRSKLGANIRNYIELNKGLELLGIGLLAIETRSPGRIPDQHFMFAGERKLVLKKGIGHLPADFVDYLARTEEISHKKAEETYNAFVSKLRFNIETNGKAQLPGLGTFFIEEEAYKFEQSTYNLKDHYYGLPSLALKPLVKSENKYIAKDPIRNPEPSKASTKEYGFLLRVAAVASILILLASLYDLRVDQLPKQEVTEIELDKSRLNQDPTKVLVSEKLDSQFIPGGVEKEEEIASCALIIGSFARLSNAIELQEKVVEAGYDLYTEEFHEFFRVGVALDCAEVRGATFKEIEQTLGIDPWLRIVR